MAERGAWAGARWPDAYNAEWSGGGARLHLALERGPVMVVHVGPGGRVPVADPVLLRAWSAELAVAASVLEHELALPRQDANGQLLLEVSR